MDQHDTGGLRSLHLFAGAGGGILADLLLGHRPVCAVEIDPYCQQVLMQRQRDSILPWFPLFGNVCEFDGTPWRTSVNIVSAGFPCQPWSVAGKRTGATDERNLWPDTIRVVCEVRPQYVFLENVPALLTQPYFGHILGSLVEAGYDCRWCVLGADDVGAPHHRKRLWILAHADQQRCPECGISDERGHDVSHPVGRNRKCACPSGQKERQGDVADAQCRGRGGVYERQQSGYVATNARWGGADGPGGRPATHHGRRVSGQGTESGDAPDPQRRELRQQPGWGCWQGRSHASLARDHGTAADVADAQCAERGPHDLACGAGGPQLLSRGHEGAVGAGAGSADDGSEWGATQPGLGGGVPHGVAPRLEWHWPDEPPGIPRVERHIPDRVARLRALGNGQVPVCAAVAWRILMTQLDGTP